MPAHHFLHLLNIHPKYAHMKHRLSHFHKHHNPKAHGSGLVHRHHHAHHVHHVHRAIEGEGAHHTKRRPTPLKFRI